MTFDSVYEMTTPITEVRKQRFWDDFSGNDLNSRWKISYSAGNVTNSPHTMSSEIDGGMVWHTNNTNATAYNIMDTNSKYTFDAESCGFITSIKMNYDSMGSENYSSSIGLHEDSYIIINTSTAGTYFQLQCRNNLVGTSTADTTVKIDTDWHTFKATTNGTRAVAYVDGVLDATLTSTLPSHEAGNLEPFWQLTNNTATDWTASIKYFEAWNI